MANEYRIYQTSGEVIHTGSPNAPERFYALSAETIHTGEANAPMHMYAVYAEVIRTIATVSATGRRRQIICT